MTKLYVLAGLFPNVLNEGFSCGKALLATSASVKISGWNDAAPYFASTNFNVSTGNYTVPVDGVYTLNATISYSTNAAITGSIGSSNPTFQIRRISPTSTTLISGQFPMLNIKVALIDIRSILGGGTVNMTGSVKLSQGDILDLYYNADTITIGMTLQNIVWSVYRIA